VLLSKYAQANSQLRESSIGIVNTAFDHLSIAFGDPYIDQIGVIQAQMFYGWMLKRKVNDKPYSPVTVKIYIEAIKTVFKWAIDANLIENNPFAKVRKIKHRAKKKVPYEDDELRRLFSACPDDRWRLIIALTTVGLRRGEILNLAVNDLDYINQEIYVQSKDQTLQTWIWKIKDTDSRIVPMTGLIEHCALRIHATLPTGQPYICLKPDRYQFLCRKGFENLSERVRKCPESNFRRSLLSIFDRANVTYKTFHALRGTAGTIMAENGLTPEKLKEVLGHSKIETTYAHYIAPRKGYISDARNAAYRQS
jgi:integrase